MPAPVYQKKKPRFRIGVTLTIKGAYKLTCDTRFMSKKTSPSTSIAQEAICSPLLTWHGRDTYLDYSHWLSCFSHFSSRMSTPAPYFARKRKRSTAMALAVYRPFKAPTYKRRKTRAFTPGRDRVGGYYGRYAGRDAELKFKDLGTIDVDPVPTAGVVTASINLIAQGTTESERIGRKCTIRKVNWRYSIILPENDAVSTPVNGDTIRIIMFIDKQANGATAIVTDILEGATLFSFRNLSNSGRFDIICDKLHNINYLSMASDGAGIVSQALVIKNFTFNANVHLPIEFSATTGAITEIRSNNIGVLLISTHAVVKFDSTLRVRFSDQG